MTANFKSIPVIDLSLANSPATRPKLLQELHHAITCIGFLYIKNHEVPQDIITDIKSTLPTLFAFDPIQRPKWLYTTPPIFWDTAK